MLTYVTRQRGGMYPMPPEAARVEVNPKPHQQYLWHLQHGYQDEVWPKLVHYRVSLPFPHVKILHN